ncbi:hypothetical protein JQX13_24095 [Archangium violaceum]|uniref:hypothetical protein n=1 Tax=Archangium violaceum TaxID=83451 RepID=UPI00193C1300|nr:hypothetical protein [Archangium violaceum]QRK12841.1 hypothetical protein JQX13_24095 [Archangium violaceum]
MRLSCQPEPPSVTLEVEQAPASGRVTEMADILVLMTAVVERVEDNPRVQAHLLGWRESAWARWGLFLALVDRLPTFTEQRDGNGCFHRALDTFE